jgi:hypothetical protein
MVESSGWAFAAGEFVAGPKAMDPGEDPLESGAAALMAVSDQR